MFLDYSGLQRFAGINRSFAVRFLQLLEYESLDTVEERFDYLRNFQNDFKCIQSLEVGNFAFQRGVMDYLFKIALSIKQMEETCEIIKRCPTVYAVEIFDHQKIEAADDNVANAGEILTKAYHSIRLELCHSIKEIITDLKPEPISTPFEEWHLLQKYLFYNYCVDIPKLMAPKRDIVIIPMNFPEVYVDKVNSNGFMNADSIINFFLFEPKDGQRSLTQVQKDSLVLKPVKDKISTIWKDGNEKDYIGTVWKPNQARDEIGSERTKYTTQPNFVTLFCDNEVASEFSRKSQCRSSNHPCVSPLSFNRKLMDAESNCVSENCSTHSVSSLYNIFSPLSSNELPTALTPPNNANELPSNCKQYIHENLEVNEKQSLRTYALLPPPPSFLPCYSDFESSSMNSQKKGLRHKLKQLFLPPFSRQKYSNDTSFSGLDTFGSWNQFQSSIWNDMSTKKFIKFKLKKMKKSYSFYKEIAKQCIEDLHDDSKC